MKPYDDTRTKAEQVEEMFDNIAPAYDRLNTIMSLGIDRYWRRAVVRRVRRAGAGRILDLATGTGDLAINLARAIPGARITGGDISENMLARGGEKAGKEGVAERIEFVRAEAEALPFPEAEFDAVTASFGVRNFHDLQRGLSEMARVLSPGGMVCIAEFSTPRNRIFGALFGFYFHRIIPRIGGRISKDRKAYHYLPESVSEFPRPEQFLQMMRESGLHDCRARALTFGVAYIYTGIK